MEKDTAPYLAQAKYHIRFERGEQGLLAVARGAAVVVVVDVLSFCTAVDLAIARGASVKPIAPEVGALEEAERCHALRAVPRNQRSDAMPYSLSPDSLRTLPAGARLILPSPNGAKLIARARQFGVPTVLAACLRNASAVAKFVRERSNADAIAVVAAGERWPDGSLRPALEDDLGAGAILAALGANGASPEALYAARGFDRVRQCIDTAIESSVSGRELIASGYRNDVERASEYDVSQTIPLVGEDGFLSMAVSNRSSTA